jgi:predicted nuclease with TOPRIM domain
MASKVLELKRQYGEEMTRLLNESFQIRASAQEYESQFSKEVADRLGPQELDRVRAAGASAWADAEMDKVRTRYIELELELRTAIDEALQSAERELAPQAVSPEVVLMAAKMSEGELIDSMDVAAAGLGDVGVETIKLCLSMARRRENFDMAIGHALELLPDLKDAYDDVVLAAEEPAPNDEPGEKWEQFAADAPSPQDILWTGGQHPMNLASRMR